MSEEHLVYSIREIENRPELFVSRRIVGSAMAATTFVNAYKVNGKSYVGCLDTDSKVSGLKPGTPSIANLPRSFHEVSDETRDNFIRDLDVLRQNSKSRFPWSDGAYAELGTPITSGEAVAMYRKYCNGALVS